MSYLGNQFFEVGLQIIAAMENVPSKISQETAPVANFYDRLKSVANFYDRLSYNDTKQVEE